MSSAEELKILNPFSGTHATVDMLEIPVYRDMIRLFELKFKVSRQIILN